MSVAGPRILEEGVAKHIAGEPASHHRVDVLVSVPVDVGEGDAVSLLQVAESSGGGHVLEDLVPSRLRNMRFGMSVRRSGAPVPR